MKAKNRRVLIIGGLVIGGIALAIFIFALRRGLSSLLIQLLTETTRIEVHTDISEYSKYMFGSEAEENYQSKWGMDESIFPAEITPNMNVLDYKMVYYDPWDAQYLGYLVVSYDDADYEKEVERLTQYASTDYLGYYGVTGFSEKYRLLSMFANSYLGFVYALTDDENTIIYVEMIFCNYFMDLDYNKYIPQDYLPLGFDATIDNAYKKEKLGDNT